MPKPQNCSKFLSCLRPIFSSLVMLPWLLDLLKNPGSGRQDNQGGGQLLSRVGLCVHLACVCGGLCASDKNVLLSSF